jgi:hypothetical protein
VQSNFTVGGETGHLIAIGGEVDCQKASMMGAHSCGDLIDVNTSHTPERSPTATYWPNNGLIIIIVIIGGEVHSNIMVLVNGYGLLF